MMQIRYSNRPRRDSSLGPIVLLVITAIALAWGGYHRSKQLEFAIIGEPPIEQLAETIEQPDPEELTQLIEGLIHD